MHIGRSYAPLDWVHRLLITVLKIQATGLFHTIRFINVNVLNKNLKNQ